MDKKTILAFRKDFAQAVKELEEKYGGEIQLGSGRYDSNSVTLKMTLTETGKNGQSAEQVEFAKVCYLYGMKPEDFGMEFVTLSGRYKLVAIRPRSPKYPMIGEEIGTGKRFKFQERAVMKYK